MVLIGPKMYNATETAPDDQHGSTKLHKDLTDAVNIMLWAAKSEDGQPGCALWHIFPPSASFLLRKFLIDDCGFTGPGDPIHSQTIYLTQDMLQRLFQKYGIRPYTIRQYPGEAVFIPVYCAHQVANLADAIKIAGDFISVLNLQGTQRLVGEFRQQRLSTSQGDDVLQFYLTLWYAWVNLSRLAKAPTGQSHDLASDLRSISVGGGLPLSVDPHTLLNHGSLGTMDIDDGDRANEYDDDDNMVSGKSTIKVNRKSEKQRARARDRKNARRRAAVFGPRPVNGDHYWNCQIPTCLGQFNRGGMLDHL